MANDMEEKHYDMYNENNNINNTDNNTDSNADNNTDEVIVDMWNLDKINALLSYKKGKMMRNLF